jgi:hypothetical protein
MTPLTADEIQTLDEAWRTGSFAVVLDAVEALVGDHRDEAVVMASLEGCAMTDDRFSSLGVDWDCDHCRRVVATGLDDEPDGWLYDENADLALCETCRTFSPLAPDPYDKVVFVQGHRHSEPVCAWPDCQTYLTRPQMAELPEATR